MTVARPRAVGRDCRDRAYGATEHAADRAIHLAGLVAAAIGAVALAVGAVAWADARTFVAIAIYLLGLLAMLLASARHNLRRRTAGEDWRRRLDHAAIFAMIAGTYTPFTACLLPDQLGVTATAAIWVAALAGIVMKLEFPRRLERISILLYLAMGWQGLIVFPYLSRLATQPAILILTGGILYSLGAGFHAWRRLPFQNAIWHGFVVVAAAFHYVAIWDGVVLAQVTP